jgi:hypothetical protein
MKKHGTIVQQKLILFLTIFTLSTSGSLLAQDVDHVYLKSGSVIRGRIIEIEPLDHVKIQDLCGNIWYYKINDVEKITSEPFKSGAKNQQVPGFESGFVNMTSIGFLAGSSYNAQVAPFSLLMVNGYRTSTGLFAGVGTGIEFFKTSYMPFFIDLRYDLFGRDVLPYLVAKGGYGVPLSGDREEYNNSFEYSGGALFGVGIGLKIRTRDHFAWDVALLYRYQETSYSETYEYNKQTYEYTDIFNRIEIRLGFYID